MSRKAVYIACPYTEGDNFINVRHSLQAAELVLRSGGLPFVPLLSAFWNFIFPHDYDVWAGMMDEWVKRCDAFLRLPGTSSGADREEDIAHDNGIPVFFDHRNLSAWLREQDSE